MLIAKCEECGYVERVPDNYAGCDLECPCGRTVHVPSKFKLKEPAPVTAQVPRQVHRQKKFDEIAKKAVNYHNEIGHELGRITTVWEIAVLSPHGCFNGCVFCVVFGVRSCISTSNFYDWMLCVADYRNSETARRLWNQQCTCDSACSRFNHFVNYCIESHLGIELACVGWY